MGQLAIYPGTFDPVTYGHIDLIKRASYIFSQVIVAVARHTPKTPLFTVDERIQMLKDVTKGMKTVSIEPFEGLVTDFAREHKSKVLVRGLRMLSDFEYEFQMALTNRRIAEKIETVFLMPSEHYSFLSSTLLKEAASLGADVSSFVPKIIEKKLRERLKRKK